MDPASQARAIAARLAASLGTAQAPAAAPLPAAYTAAYGTAPAADDPVARARAIAAKLGLTMASAGTKRSLAEAFPTGSGDDQKVKRKIYIPVTAKGALIGPAGATQKRLESESGARVYLRGRGASKDPSDPEASEDLHVIIAGDTEEQVARAEALVNELVFAPHAALEAKRALLRSLADGGSGGAPTGANAMPFGGGAGDGEAVEVLTVPNAAIGAVIGRGGETIRELQTRTGCRVQVQREADVPLGSTDRTVTLTGPAAAVAAAKISVLAQVESRTAVGVPGAAPPGYGPGAGAGGPGGPVTLTVSVPEEAVGVVIGKQGTTIRGIQARTGAHINIPRDSDPTSSPPQRVCVVSAPSYEAANAAIAEVHHVVSTMREYATPGGQHHAPGADGTTGAAAQSTPAEPQAVVQFKLPEAAVGAVIGRGGANIRELQGRFSVRLTIPREADPGSAPPTRTVSVTGSQANAEAARAEVEAIVAGERGAFGQVVVGVPGPQLGMGMPGGFPGGPGGPLPGYGGAPPFPGGYGAPNPYGYGAPPPFAGGYGAPNPYGYGAPPPFAGGPMGGAAGAPPMMMMMGGGAGYYPQYGQAPMPMQQQQFQPQQQQQKPPQQQQAAPAPATSTSEAEAAAAWAKYYAELQEYEKAVAAAAAAAPAAAPAAAEGAVPAEAAEAGTDAAGPQVAEEQAAPPAADAGDVADAAINAADVPTAASGSDVATSADD